MTYPLFSALLLLIWNLRHSFCSAGPPLQSLSPRDVRFVSEDYRNVLHWNPPADASGDLRYFVQWKIYGEKQWRGAAGCHGVSRLTCDLSLETSEPREWYYAQVHTARHGGQSPWVLSPRFNPSWETTASPPKLRVSVEKQRILVHLRPPLTPYRNAKGRRLSLAKLQRLTFKVYLIHTSGEEDVFEVSGCIRELEIPGLSPGTRYCLQAQSLQPLLGHSSHRTPRTCVSTL